MNHRHSFTTEVEENIATGELMITIPEEIINSMDWYEGSELEWVLDNGEVFLRDPES